jgi:two-component system chemotaxis response regulator CheB
MLALKNKNVLTIAQDEKSCVVFGMPREAIEIGAATCVESIEKIAEKICLLTNDKSKSQKAKIA